MSDKNDPKREKTERKKLDASACRYLSEKELAERWNIDERTLQGHRQTGDGLPFYKLGGRVMYRKREIYDYERAARRTSTSDSGPENLA